MEEVSLSRKADAAGGKPGKAGAVEADVEEVEVDGSSGSSERSTISRALPLPFSPSETTLLAMDSAALAFSAACSCRNCSGSLRTTSTEVV